MAKTAARVVCRPLTPARWPDLERLFGPRGACAGCWCMWFRQSNAEFAKGRGAANRRALQCLVRSGAPTGVLAYAGGEPVGWCAVAPREHYRRLERSRVLKPVDDRPAWSVPCFFVSSRFRRRGVTRRLLEAAVDYAAKRGATLIEGYPVEPRSGTMPDLFGYHGVASVFRRVGFVEAVRRSPTRRFMRLEVRPAKRSAAARGTARAARGARAGAGARVSRVRARRTPARGRTRG